MAEADKNTALRKLLDQKYDRIAELEAEVAALKAALKRAAGEEIDISRCPACKSSDHTFSNNGRNRCNDCNHTWVP